MELAARIAVLFVGVLHVLFMYMEMVLFPTDKGRKIFGVKKEDVETMRVLAANQGIYNGALAAVLIWAEFAGQVDTVKAMLIFVVVVGIYGAATASRSILFLQVIPAVIALGLVFAV
ncbi:MAG: DUF1304 domain-containing protein [Deltaproteobacteria bacterium]|nr:DUF1304 domain-containing protein [Deltaproteobacteria bacterium]